MRRAAGSLVGRGDVAEGLGYTLKRRLLGRPLINEQLGEQRLSKVIALGVLAPDGISSSAYGTEEILIELLKGGLALTAFSIILPMTGVVLGVMALVVLSYREVVMVYTRAGGSYVVARENFGPKVAQVAAVALLIDYVVTVAVQIAAGTAAVASAIPALNNPTTITVISIAVVLLMCYGNLRGIREAGRSFAVPTYLFSAVVILMIIVGLVREALGDLGRYPYPNHVPGNPQYGEHIGHNTSSLIAVVMIFTLLRAFANGGSSLTGIEAVSNAVSAFRPPEGINARRVLVFEGLILGSLVAGISWMAHVTHAAPYRSGVPTVISQEAKIAFGHGFAASALFFLVQAATALILYTGGNTSFNGFPFLTSFVAEDAFLPRWLTKRGHRLVFSNGIIVLAVLSSTLLAVVGANVNSLVPFYAIGVFTAFTMAGFGMAKFHHRAREPHWRRKLAINFSAGVTSMIVVLIFVVVKFTEGAWLVVILFAAGVPALIWLNRQYGLEATVLERLGDRRQKAKTPPEPVTYSRRSVFVFVDEFDLATIAALRYARSLRPTSLQAVHFVVDNVQADRLRQDWIRANTGIPLEFVDCPDRRIAAAAGAMANAEATLPGVGVTAILPRRSYAPVVGRLLHDRTADKMAQVISRIPYAVATIVPFDVRSRVESLAARHADGARREAAVTAAAAADQVPPSGKPAEPAKADAKAEAAAGDGQAKDKAKDKDKDKDKADASSGAGTEAGTGTRPDGDQPPAAGTDQAAAPAGTGSQADAGQAAVPDRAEAGGAEAGGAEPEPDSPIRESATAEAAEAGGEPELQASDGTDYDRPAPPAGVNPIGSLTKPTRAVVQGRVHAVEIRPVEHSTVLACDVADSTGELTALFYGRSNIPGLRPGSKVRLRGQVGMKDGQPVMINPAYELLAHGDSQGRREGGKPRRGRGPRKGPDSQAT